MADEVGRTLPHNLEAERSVLGAILIDNSGLNDVAQLQASDFFRDAHRRIYKRMLVLAERRLPIDLVAIKEALEQEGELEEVGGPAYVASLVDGVPRSTNVEYYAQIVKQKATLRNLIFTASQIISDAYEAGTDADAIVDRAEQLVMEVGKSASKGEFVMADEWMIETARIVEKAAAEKRIITGIPTGIKKLDYMLRGLQNGDLIYLGARPSSGKTALALQMALEASHHTMTGFISLEMSRTAIGMRAVSMSACVDHFRLSTGHLSEFELSKVFRSMSELAERQFAIDDASGTATQIRAKARRFAARKNLGALFIDYMQLVHDTVEAENRNHELSKISWGWKMLARELNIPIIVLSQLSRGVQKENRRPQMSDLRDSGSLEQDADVGLLLWRPQMGDSGKYEDGEEAEIIVGKQRNGPIGPVRLQWLGEQMRFGPLEEQASEPKQESMV